MYAYIHTLPNGSPENLSGSDFTVDFVLSDCFGVLDCEWCTVDSDGKTHLDKPYCALQKECFGGIVGAKSPYVDSLGLMGEWRQYECE